MVCNKIERDFYSARYHRLAARRGKKRALMAVGHSILKTVYHIIKGEEEYKELGATCLDSRLKAGRKACFKKGLENLGFHVELKPFCETAVASDTETTVFEPAFLSRKKNSLKFLVNSIINCIFAVSFILTILI